MPILAFWCAVIAVWLYFALTTPAQRRQLAWSFWTVLFLAGGAGLAWSLLR